MSEISLDGFADKLNEIMPVIMKEFARRQVCELYKGKITLPQFLVMDFLHRNGQSQMTQIANFMGVTTAATTGIVARLVKCGFCARGAEPADRRIIKVRLTQKGNELVKKVNEERHKMVLKIFGRISDKDRSDYLRILEQIKTILTEES